MERARSLPAARIVLVGLHGRRQVDRRPVARRRAGRQALDSDRELERRLGEPIESFFDREGEAAFRAREEEVVSSCSPATTPR